MSEITTKINNLKGNLTSDPATKTVTMKDGRLLPCTEFTVAINLDREQGTGCKTLLKRMGLPEDTPVLYFKCTAWGDRAIEAYATLKKGSFVNLLSGDVEVREWTSRNGVVYKELKVHDTSYRLIPVFKGQKNNNDLAVAI